MFMYMASARQSCVSPPWLLGPLRSSRSPAYLQQIEQQSLGMSEANTPRESAAICYSHGQASRKKKSSAKISKAKVILNHYMGPACI